LRSTRLVPDTLAVNSQPTSSEGSSQIAAVVLAAGSSSRMGRNKLLFDVGGEALVRRIVRTASVARLDPIVVVLGHDADAVRGAIAPLGCQFVVNARHAEGMKRSVCAGIAAVPGDVAAAVVLLGDMPLVGSDQIVALVERYRSGNDLMMLSDYGGVTAPPTLIDRSLFVELTGDPVRGCSRTLRSRYPERAATLSCPTSALADVDVPADYDRLRSQLMSSSQCTPS
jgi:molybdenum cofactor cytidylyltransferase